ncbi:MAG TPA: protein-glutamate O-methyltransferase CheR [Candidatus Sulfotelmatobacter sp.]|nr:protein-glutamate O-methyltransferase CheR [Candidatus Sulfotelmatobacter sp.]
MKAEDFDFLCRVVRERSGLQLTRDKAYLLESRLLPVARRLGAKSLEEFIDSVRRQGDPERLRIITEAMTTNETLFFRDTKPFEQFKRVVLPALLEGRAAQRTIRIWCAASSSGQEPYSLAMTIKEEGARLAGWRFEVLATDLSQEMVDRARAGTYSQFEVQRGLPIQLLMKYFRQVDERWQLDDAIRGMVQYRVFNLLDDPRPLGTFDIVFCRNVLIYFDQPTKAQVLERIAKLMPRDGILYLGGAETVLGITDRFEPMPNERGIYRPAQKVASALGAAS